MMEISVPSPPSSAHLLIVGVWMFAGVVPLLYLAKSGWRKTLRYSFWSLVGTAPLVLPYSYAVQTNSVEVAHGRIHVQAGLLYQLSRSVDDLKLEEAVAAPLRDIPQARLSARLSGIGASGYAAGSFSLAKGGQAFVLITDPAKTVFLPSKAGASLLISVNDPQGLLDILRSQAAQDNSVRDMSSSAFGTVLPNPSLKRSANGRPPGPVWRYAVHFRQPGPGVLPSSPA